MSLPHSQRSSTTEIAADLLCYIIDQISTEPKPHSSPENDSSESNGQSSSSTALQESSDSHESTEIIRDIVDLPQWEPYTTSSVLNFCKNQVLLPYQKFLAILGWRPFGTVDSGWFIKIINVIYVIIVVLFTLFGYILQYAACYRQDVAGYKILHTAKYNETSKKEIVCTEGVLDTFLVPDILHLCAYVYMYYHLRIRESEQVQVLMERVYLQAYHSRPDFSARPPEIRTLKMLLSLTIGWILYSVCMQALHIIVETPYFSWMQPTNKSTELVLVVLLAMTVIWTDVIHITVIACYSIHCQLLHSFIRGLCGRVKERTITLEETIKQIGESAKALKYLNDDFQLPIALTMIHSGMMIVSGLVWIASEVRAFNEIHPNELPVIFTNLLGTLMWIGSFVFPLIQAARLTAACSSYESIGLYIMTRPFGYHEEPLTNLQPFLAYTSSLKMQAKLFRVPIKPWVLFGMATASGCTLIILAECNVLKFGF